MSLKPAQLGELYEKARLLGHNPSDIEQGRECCTYFTIPTLEDGRRLFSMATEDQRQKRQQTFFNPGIAIRQRLGQGMHDRGEAMAFAAGSIVESDRYGLERHLPLHVKAISVAEKTIRANEVWDVSVRGDVWGLDDMEELYVTVNVGKLIIEPGASLVVRGNVFSLLCQHIIQGETAGGDRSGFQIGILPTPFSVDLAGGPMDGLGGSDGSPGRNGSDGRTLDSEETFLGLRLREAANTSVMNGGDGEAGKPGEDGGRGRNGGMCKLAELTIRQVTGHVTVFAQAGAGGNGGHGGHGGDGGHGGHAGHGLRLLTGVLPGGNGGGGGRGGNGGSGGSGGNGGIASNIYINVPTEDEHKITRIARSSVPGRPGAGGRGGKGGNGGAPGKGPDAEAAYEGNVGAVGAPGHAGQMGRPGRSRHAPWMFLNEEPNEERL